MENRIGLHIFFIFLALDWSSVNTYTIGSLFPALADRITVKQGRNFFSTICKGTQTTHLNFQAFETNYFLLTLSLSVLTVE